MLARKVMTLCDAATRVRDARALTHAARSCDFARPRRRLLAAAGRPRGVGAGVSRRGSFVAHQRLRQAPRAALRHVQVPRRLLLQAVRVAAAPRCHVLAADARISAEPAAGSPTSGPTASRCTSAASARPRRRPGAGLGADCARVLLASRLTCDCSAYDKAAIMFRGWDAETNAPSEVRRMLLRFQCARDVRSRCPRAVLPR